MAWFLRRLRKPTRIAPPNLPRIELIDQSYRAGVGLHLRGVVDLARAVLSLQERAVEGRNLVGSSAGQSVPVHQNRYLEWVATAEIELRNIFTDPSTWQRLYGDRYWHIRSLTAESPRAIELINDEGKDQAAWLERLALRLRALADRLDLAPGRLTVLDTHVLLHGLPPDQIPWQEIVGADNVRLVLPLRVIEELDAKKYTAREDLADRARRLLSQLRSMLAPTAGSPVELRGGVTIELPVDDEPRHRNLDADQEILETCQELQSAGAPVVLVSDDTGMFLRATAVGLTVVALPEQYLRRRPQPEPAELGDT